MANSITPPPELVRKWCAHNSEHENYEQFWHYIAAQAAQWGADQELEAIEEEIIAQGWFANSVHRRAQLRAARRPKPPSLKEQALEQLGCIQADLNKFGMGISTETIRRALEALDD
jgi:hypothetical protein